MYEGVPNHRVSSAASQYNAHINVLESILFHSVSRVAIVKVDGLGSQTIQSEIVVIRSWDPQHKDDVAKAVVADIVSSSCYLDCCPALAECFA